MRVRTISKSQVVLVALLSLGLWGISCADKSGLDLWTVKGEKDPMPPDAMPPPVECTDENVATKCDDQNPCTLDRCSPVGLCENTANEGAIPPTSDNPCRLLKCDKGQLAFDVPADGAVCAGVDGGVQICRSGQCVPGCALDGDCSAINGGYCFEFACFGCNDGVKNGDETGVDCGGMHCLECLGASCSNMDECGSQHCVDGVCCNEACTGKCHTCIFPNLIGTCQDTPRLLTDDNPGDNDDCKDNQQCTGDGKCKTAIGSQCGSGNECVTNYCFAAGNPDICQVGPAEDCTANPLDCFSDYCDPMTNKCTYVPIGKPCEYTEQCLTGTCISGKCT